LESKFASAVDIINRANFDFTTLARRDAAKADWSGQRFGTVAGEGEFIPLPPG
jgi:hypothetical protein